MMLIAMANPVAWYRWPSTEILLDSSHVQLLIPAIFISRASMLFCDDENKAESGKPR